MKVLSLVWFKVLPPKFGGQKGIAFFQAYLAQHLDLVCLCSRNNEPVAPTTYRIRPELPIAKSQFFNPLVWITICRVVREEKPDVLLLEFPYHTLAAWIVRRLYGVKIVLHLHNVEHLRFRQLGKSWWPLLRLYERWACSFAERVLVKTEGDRQRCIDSLRCAPKKIQVVPFGVEKPLHNDGSSLRTRLADADTYLLLFAGTLDYLPNATAVQDLFHRLAPALDAQHFRYRIVVCGRNREPAFQWLNSLQHPHVTLAGEVDDIEPYFHAADLFVCPVLTGGGIQTKIIDALAHDCPVVAFAFAANDIPRHLCGNNLHVADDGDWQQFAALILTAVQQRENTPAQFFQHYAWDTIAADVAEQIKSLRR